MSDNKTYAFAIHEYYSVTSKLKNEKEKLYEIVVYNRVAKKICRKCYRRLPLNSNICRACKNPDIRVKKSGKNGKTCLFDKRTKNKLLDAN